MAFFFNLYQIFGIHCFFNNILDLNKTKSSIYGYFQNDVKLTYKFKNFSLNHLDVLHILFRNNKPIPGSYMRLVYSSDIKCKLLPKLYCPEALFIAYKVNDSFYTIYNKKEIMFQLEDRILKLIPELISMEEENEITIKARTPMGSVYAKSESVAKQIEERLKQFQKKEPVESANLINPPDFSKFNSTFPAFFCSNTTESKVSIKYCNNTMSARTPLCISPVTSKSTARRSFLFWRSKLFFA